MRSKLFLGTMLVFAAFSLVSCLQEEILSETNTTEKVEETVDELANDAIQEAFDAYQSELMMNQVAGDRATALPDFIITSNTITDYGTTTNCGPSFPDLACGSGPTSTSHGTRQTIVIENVGDADFPAGNLNIRWIRTIRGSSQLAIQNQTLPTAGIPVGGSLSAEAPWNLGPCDCVQPPSYGVIGFIAFVNVPNAVTEFAYGNNRSPIVRACDGC